ncbi:MAG: helix-turn-helix transcriptional regulator [Micromonosporaceae bacterium]|nr:helix-turn-helix transcriptional regulator [Micromonosporaceae bacterium]
MTERTEVLAGHILRTWREYAGCSAAQVARALNVAPSAVTNWEKGDRGRRPAAFVDIVERYAAALGLGAHESKALVGLWRAARSPAVIPARTEWAHNYAASPGPVWAWIRTRSRPGRVSGAVQWDPFQSRIDVPSSAGGLIIQAPTSVPNPPFVIVLNEPGWTDFGEGHVPEEIATSLGITYLRAGTFIGPPMVWGDWSPLSDSDLRALTPSIKEGAQLAARLGLRWVLGRNRSPRHARDGGEVDAGRCPGPTAVDELGPVSQLLISPAKAQEIRQSRGLSRAVAAALASRLEPQNPVTDKMIERLEDTGRIPSPPRTLARLDMVYGMDGWFGVDRTFHSDTHGVRSDGIVRIGFAGYWRGPVWVQVRNENPLAVCTVELTWGPWRRRQRMPSGGVLTTRKATTDAPPLCVRVPPGWRVVAGLGAIPTALDVNQGWYPHDIVGAIATIRGGLQSVRRALSDAAADAGE